MSEARTFNKVSGLTEEWSHVAHSSASVRKPWCRDSAEMLVMGKNELNKAGGSLVSFHITSGLPRPPTQNQEFRD